MSKVIKLKKGLDLRLVGEAEKTLDKLPLSESYAVCPTEFEGVTPKLLVKVGDKVKAGTPLFFNKYKQEILFSSPVSGEVSAINRGEKRKVLSVVIKADAVQEYENFEIKPLEQSSSEDIKSVLLSSGLWPMIIQRPYGVIADPMDTPKSIFVSGFDSAPLAPDMNFVLTEQLDNLRTGFDVLSKLTSGKVHLSLNAKALGVLDAISNVEKHQFQGPHPAGNVGVQIHHIDPIAKGEMVWTVGIQDLAIIGRLFNTGKVDMTKIVALTGGEVEKPRYVQAIAGAPIADIVGANKPEVRIINGNVLTGKTVAYDGYLGIYNNQITVISDNADYEMLGWAKPFRPKRFSVAKSYFSWLCPRKRYNLDTHMNGGPRAFVVTGLYEQYLPMDIYPLYLLKAILAEDIDKMENLGIYEVVEEDLALCEFVDPSKSEMQEIVRRGINLMIKEN
ncbi:MAG: Na(+)-translocating NADH-quinone reductase subunit A [Rikenellaceae bacterium]|nr:Na(+)-translocating NADH-quinone reductase subunit A [Rikenellaceae bacterium]